MKVVVDTSVWSLALRRNAPDDATFVVNQLRDLITDGRVVLVGAVRQEVLSGIRYLEQFIFHGCKDKLTEFLCCYVNSPNRYAIARIFSTSRRRWFRTVLTHQTK